MTHCSRGTEVIGVKLGVESVVYRVSLNFLRIDYGQGHVNVIPLENVRRSLTT